jgi:protein TonB
MRRDLIIGILCSVLVHAGLGLGGEINLSFLNRKKKVVKEEAPTIQLMELPKLDPEPPEVTESDGSSADTAVVAPPSMVDVPGVVNLGDFVQPVQPPPPPKAGLTMTVPKTNTVPTGGMGQIFDLKNLDQQPVLRHKVDPVYPFEMKRQGIGADVIVEFVCSASGEVMDPHIVKSTNHAFDNAAIDAILKWRFRPGKKGGRAVGARMQQPFSFSITED